MSTGEKPPKPTPLQYFYASPWLERVWFSIPPFIFLFHVVSQLRVDLLWSDWKYLVSFLILFVTALFSGVLVAFFLGVLVLGPIFKRREMSNGGPFKAGDIVQILCGPHKGKVVSVDSEWQGGSVRVVLDDDSREHFTDIFTPVELMRQAPRFLHAEKGQLTIADEHDLDGGLSQR